MARRTPSAEPRSGEKRARGGSDAKRRAPVREAAPRTGFSARQNLNALLVCVAIVAASFVVYGQLAHHAFIHFDDDLYIYQNPHVVSGLSWSNVAWALTEYRSNTWHPMAWISHMLDCQLFGLDAGKHHMMSVWIHTLNSVLLLLLLRRLTGSLWRSAVVAAFFAVHPMHVESVAWASERKDVLSMLFALLAIWAYSGYARRPGAARYVLTLAMVALAIMSKPMMVTLPFVLLLLDYWPLRRFGWPTASARSGGFRASLIIDKLPMLALAGGAAVLTMMAERGLQQHTLWMRLTTALVSRMKYAGKLLVPLTQAFYYPYPSQPPVLPALGCALVLVGVTWWFIHIRRTHPYALVGWLWYLGTLAPVIGLEQVATHAMADRYSYAPSIGLSIVVVWGLTRIALRWPRGRVVLAALVGLAFVATTARARIQAGYWKDGVTLFTQDVRVVKHNALGWRNLGVSLCDAGRYEEAIPNFKKVLEIYPKDAVSMFDIASALEKLNRLPEAVESYRASLREDPNRTDAHYNLGSVLGRMGQTDAAIEELRAAIRLQPNFAPAYNNLGNVLGKAGRDSLAIESYLGAIRANPAYPEAYNNLGTSYRKLGRLDEALEQFNAALRLRPDFAAAEFNAGVVYAGRGETDQARLRFAAAVRLDPNLAANVPPELR